MIGQETRHRYDQLMRRAIVTSILVITLFWLLFPMFNLVLLSVKPQKILFDVPPKYLFVPTAEYYMTIFHESQYIFFLNSVVVTGASTLLALFIGSLGAFSFSNFRFRMSNFFFFLILITRMYPPVTTLIPAYFMIRYLGLLDTRTALIIVYTGFQLPLVVWVMKSFFKTVPRSIQESAYLDGCSDLGIFFRIILPLSKPGIAAAGVLIFILNWNEFLFALILTSIEARTMPVLISSYMEMEKGLKWETLAAIGFLSIFPIIVFMFAFRQYLVKGLMLGALKE